MPRAKVHESNRQRAVQACAPCKVSKRRCDCQQPCSNCVKRRDVESCVFKDHLPRVAGHASKAKSRASTTATATASGSTDRDTPQSQAPSRSSTARHVSSTEGPHTAPHMLWTSRGVQVYVGSSASLSFLILLRDSLTRYTGSSSFTDASQSSVMLENRAPMTGDDHLIDCPHSFEEHVSLLDVYYAATSGILDVLPEKSDVISQMRTMASSGKGIQTQVAVLHAIIAIGAQCRGGLQDRQCERIHIAKARKVAFCALQEDQLDVNLVRVFIIMAYYMFGACRRNTAFMYIGIAARASDALGLHLQPDRIYLWKSVRILDLLVAAILGRSPATLSTEPTSSVAWKSEQSNNSLTHRQLCLNASFDVWSIIDQVVQEFYRKGRADTSVARGFLNRLSKWSADLSSPLKSHPPQELVETTEQRGYVIGNIHVSCAYYYAVVIATRKYLITVLHRFLSGARDTSPQNNKVDSIETTQLAQACIDSAVLLLQTCREVHDAGMLLDNMCLLKAWIFAAGMIVGFAFFVDPDTYTGLDQALVDACHVLQHLSILSAQAKQYHDILQALHKAATEHHERLAAKSQTQPAPLVSKIFSLGQGSLDLFDGLSHSDNTLLSSSLPTDDSFPMQMNFAGDFEGMDSVAAQFWDELLLDREQFQL